MEMKQSPFEKPSFGGRPLMDRPPFGGKPPVDDPGFGPGGPPPEWKPPMADVSWVKRKFLDVPYGTESPRQCFDLYLPEEGDGPFPLFVHIHGGGFAFGDKRDDHMDAYLEGIRRGYAVASVEYRVSGEAAFPAAVLDCREAVRHIKAHAAEYCVDPGRIAVLGGSAGGNLAAMLGMNVPNGGFPGEEGRTFSCEPTVQVCVDQFGPVRFETMEAQARANGVSETHPDPAMMPESKYLGVPVDKAPAELLTRAYPGTYASRAMAPLLVQHGTADHLVPWAQSEEFVRDLCARGFADKVEYAPLEGADHEDKRFTAKENMELVFAFIGKHIR
ncbi:MAG: alpha/beta hydrolase fold domain-containing protein [Faecousia sp.]